MNGQFFFVPADPEQEAEDLRLSLKHAAARRVFRRLLAWSNVMGLSRGEGNGTTDYNEGLRAVGLLLAAKIETAAPGEIARLMAEGAMAREAARNNKHQEEQ
jgi:hypothetical protein